MLFRSENSIYSILSPEGYATILWKDSSRVREAADVMKLTPEDLIKQGIIDKIIPEVRTSAEIKQFKAQLFDKMEELRAMPEQEMLQKRFTRYRGF